MIEVIKERYNKFKALKNSQGKPSKPAKYVISKYITEEEKEYLNKRWKDSDSLNESLSRIVYNITERHRCPVCGKFTEFINKNDQLYRMYCSWECKKKNTDLVKRHRQWCLRKYGVENISQVPGNREKFAKTMIERYGHPNNFSRPEVTESIINKYGTPYVSSLEDVKRKKIETMKQNGSFNKSSVEDNLYAKIKEVYPDTIRQYRDKQRYDWNCDFYIPKLDLFIEYQGFITHNSKPFDNNNYEHINELNNLKEAAARRSNELGQSSVYDSIIKTWTIADPLKRETAKKNNLNFIEIWPDWSEEKIFNEIKQFERN